MSKPKFPIVINRGSVSVKVYHTPTRQWDSYTVVHYQDGRRKRSLFGDLNVARTEAEMIATRLGNTDADVLTLTSADRAAYIRAREALDAVGIPIESAAVEMAQAARRLQGVPLARAVDFYLQRHPVGMKPRTVPEVVAELIEAKKHDGLSVEYLRQLRMALESFAKQFPGPIGEVRGAAMDEWLRGLGWAPRTRNNMRSSVQTLFNFAIARKHLPKDHDELDAVARVKDGEGEIEVFTPAEMAEILQRADEALIPFLALGAFAGIRHAEIVRLDWRDIHFEDGIIEIRAAKAKTASRRTIPLLDNLRAWLSPFRQADGLVCEYRNVSNQMDRLVRVINAAQGGKAAGGKRKGNEVTAFKWKHNALRHSFISYRVAAIQNVAQVALEAGNSPQMIFRHYRELVRPADAVKWFAIAPETPANVVGMATKAA